MDWNQYQEWADTKFIDGSTLHPAEAKCLAAALGLAGEAGEVCDLLKKSLFHDKPLSKGDLCKELGDTLYYLAMVAALCGVHMSEVVEGNINKLNARYPTGFDPARAHAHGSGSISPAEWPKSDGE